MTNHARTQTTITVEETYRFSVDIGDQTNINFTQGNGSVRIQIPYDKRSLEQNQQQSQFLELGRMSVRSAQSPTIEEFIPIQLPATALQERIKQGMQYVWEGEYDLPAPQDTLVAIDGAIFDGADITADSTTEAFAFQDILFGQTDVFVSDLQLQLSLWVPDLIAQQNRERQSDMLRTMLFEQESTTQILLPDITNIEQIAQSMAALANTIGGQILFGVKQSGEVLGISEADLSQRLQLTLLKAALRSKPAIVFFAPKHIKNNDGKIIVRLVIPPSTKKPHTTANRVYRRNGSETQINTEATSAKIERVPHPIGDLRDILANGNTRDVAILDVRDQSINQLELGPYISGLFNADISNGLLVVRNIQADQATSNWPQLWNNQRSIVQQFEARLRDEIAQMTPVLNTLQPEFATIDNQRVMIIRVPRQLATVALYNNKAYLWNDGVLREISIQDTFGRYLERLGIRDEQGPMSSPVQLEYAELSWPVQPPSQLKLNPAIASPQLAAYTYATQRHAVAWKPQLFEVQTGTNGLQAQLLTRLRHAFTNTVGEEDGGRILRGRMCLRFDDVLASGFEIQPADNPPHALFQQVQIKKQTYIMLDVTVRAYELFRRRRLTSLLHFRKPDVALGSERRERIADLRQVCADIGFWVYGVYSPNTSDELPPYVVLRGIRSSQYHDVHLLVGIRYEPNQLTRELRYAQRTDSKHVQTGILDIRIVLSGMVGEHESNIEIQESLEQLQLQLRELLNQRLDYLRSE